MNKKTTLKEKLKACWSFLIGSIFLLCSIAFFIALFLVSFFWDAISTAIGIKLFTTFLS